MATFQEIEIGLRQRLEFLEGRVVEVEDGLRHTHAPLEADFAEQAVSTENDDVLQALDSALRAEYAEILAVLRRIEMGSYGFCSACGDEVPVKRLRAVPFARECVACASGA
jgi:DnaK suppressor protein